MRKCKFLVVLLMTLFLAVSCEEEESDAFWDGFNEGFNNGYRGVSLDIIEIE